VNRDSRFSQGATPRSSSRRLGEAAAAAMGVEVITRRLGSGLLGLTVSDNRVVISASLRGFERQFTIAHELGHVQVRRGQYAPRSPLDEEAFADAYARQMLGEDQPAIAD